VNAYNTLYSSSDNDSNSSSSSEDNKFDIIERIHKEFRIQVRAIKQMSISVDEKKKLIRDQIVNRKKRELSAKIEVLKKKKNMANNSKNFYRLLRP
jgi:hypothetical protein